MVGVTISSGICVVESGGYSRHSWDAANFKLSKSYSAQLKVSNNISNIEILFENFTFQITKNKLKCLKLVIILESRNGFSLEVVWIF